MSIDRVFLAALAALSFTACKQERGERPAAVASGGEAVEAAAPPPSDGALLERGKYVADLMGCEQCHTPFGPEGPDPARAFAGGLEIPEPFGTWRSTNITQDRETGIGAWTDAQILAAIREGKRPDGDQLFPIMPYPLYHQLSDADGAALIAYLRTVPPVVNQVERATDLKLPKIPMPPAAGAEPPADPVGRGAYLASLMHCAMCHTPPGADGAPDLQRAFAGGMKFELPMMGTGALFSSNLTPDPATGVGAWKDEDLLAAVRGMTKRDGSLIVGPMALYQQGWFRVTEDDGKALVAFLRSLPAIVNRVPSSTFAPRAPAAGPG